MSTLDDRTMSGDGNVCIWFDWDGERWGVNSAAQEYREGAAAIGDDYEPSASELRLFAAALLAEAERKEAR